MLFIQYFYREDNIQEKNNLHMPDLIMIYLIIQIWLIMILICYQHF